jgi:hypothetical protein
MPNRDRSSPARTFFFWQSRALYAQAEAGPICIRKLCWEALVETWVYRCNISGCFSDVLSPLLFGAPDSCPAGSLLNPVLVTCVAKWRPCQEKCFVLAIHKLIFFLFMCCDILGGIPKTLKSWLVEDLWTMTTSVIEIWCQTFRDNWKREEYCRGVSRNWRGVLVGKLTHPLQLFSQSETCLHIELLLIIQYCFSHRVGVELFWK